MHSPLRLNRPSSVDSVKWIFGVCVDKTLTVCLAVSRDHGQGVAVGTPRQQRVRRIPARLETPTASRARWMVLRLKYYSGMRNYICWPTQ